MYKWRILIRFLQQGKAKLIKGMGMRSEPLHSLDFKGILFKRLNRSNHDYIEEYVYVSLGNLLNIKSLHRKRKMLKVFVVGNLSSSYF